MSGKEFTVEVQAKIPETLKGLTTLSRDLTYSWSRQIRSLFFRLDQELWDQCNHNPKVFLRRVSQQKLEDAIGDTYFMEDYKTALNWYEDYCQGKIKHAVQTQVRKNQDLIAYFSLEFGFHESLPIYSGGLGILAGDHCKAASDLGLPFVGVGLLYHQGYFKQTIDGNGHQIAEFNTHRFQDLPIQPVCNDDGSRLTIQIELADHSIDLCIWVAKVGNIQVYLLDSDVPSNKADDRSITYRLYGGDREHRVRQEMVLGIGGVRALRALGLAPNIWHINEGHSAFQIVERISEYVQAGLQYTEALEAVASATVFTTHTPVPAGHDIFEHDLVRKYLAAYFPRMNVDANTLMAMGVSDGNPGKFNMTALAMRASRHQNGVSRIHGRVASQMEAYIWPEIPPADNPVSYITNGVHVPTFLAREWGNLFDSRFRNWHNYLSDSAFWDCLDEIEDYRFWGIRQSLRSLMLRDVCERVVHRYRRNGASESFIRKATQLLMQPDPDLLVLGFARRFATYKRATLLFADRERLKKLLNDPKRPVMLIFAGKAHPQDEPGQELIRIIHEYSQHPDFLGRVILLENYDIALGRKLVTGVDVWVNNPEYPLEACGTSGQKAAINGVLNLSVLDGWWDEGYNGKNGWAVIPHEPHYDYDYRYHEEAFDLINILEQQVVPTFYDRGNMGYSEKWIAACRESMKSIIPRFNSERMVMDYLNRVYSPSLRKHEVLMRDSASGAKLLAAWKQKIRKEWKNVSLTLLEASAEEISYQDQLMLKVKASLGNLGVDDVRVELLLGIKEDMSNEFVVKTHHLLKPEPSDSTEIFALSVAMENCGLLHYKICIYPYHELLAHPFEMGFMKWL
ncbi:MAG: alpha-glucan family phosphorylase [Gammaproteobacteria bacterium]|nr:alpha-glucan family phosphorylase [Gammaproteobacteria bacterium]